MTQPLEPRKSGPQKSPSTVASNAGRGAPSPPLRREKPACEATVNRARRWPLWGLLSGAALAALSVGAISVVYFAGTRNETARPLAAQPGPAKSAAPVPALVLEWPVEERGWSKLSIDGEERPVPRAGELRYPLPPRAGAYRVVLSRAGYETQELNVQSTAERPPAPHHVRWTPAADSDADSSAPATAGPADPAFDDWLQDFEKARQVAAAERKNVLLLFAISDGGRASQRLLSEVCSQPKFKEQAGRDFVLVWLDFPRGEEARAKVQNRARNAALKRDFQIAKLPAVILTSARGRPFGSLGWVPGGLDSFLSALERQKEVGVQLERALERVAAATDTEARSQAVNQVCVLLRQHDLAHHYSEFSGDNKLVGKENAPQQPEPTAAPAMPPGAKMDQPVAASPPGAASAPKIDVVAKLIDARVDLTLSTGETLTNRQVLRVGRGKDENTVVSLTLADGASGKTALLGAMRIREVALPGGRALFVYDLARKALVPPDQVTLRRGAGKPAGAMAVEGSAAGKAVPAEAGPDDSDLRWPELSDDEQRKAVDEQREALKLIGPKVPNGGLRLYETKRFLFYSDLPAQVVRTVYVPYLDQMYVQLCTAYGIDPNRNIWKGKATIIAFAQALSFREYEVQFHNAESAAAGLAHEYSDGKVIISCYACGSPADFGKLLVHETVHGFNFRHRSAERLPSWLDEGIADWVAGRVVTGSQWVRRRVDDAIQQMRVTRSLGGNFFDAEQIEAWQYGAATRMVDFLLCYTPPPNGGASPVNRRDKQEPLYFRRFVETIKAGKPWPDALWQVYRLKLPELIQAYGLAIGIPNLQP